jgi:hypothetical protein
MSGSTAMNHGPLRPEPLVLGQRLDRQEHSQIRGANHVRDDIAWFRTLPRGSKTGVL